MGWPWRCRVSKSGVSRPCCVWAGCASLSCALRHYVLYAHVIMCSPRFELVVLGLSPGPGGACVPCSCTLFPAAAAQTNRSSTSSCGCRRSRQHQHCQQQVVEVQAAEPVAVEAPAVVPPAQVAVSISYSTTTISQPASSKCSSSILDPATPPALHAGPGLAGTTDSAAPV
jgi:hypothetical protein